MLTKINKKDKYKKNKRKDLNLLFGRCMNYSLNIMINFVEA